MKYTVQSIRDRYNAGEALRVIAFWGHTREAGKKMTKACLSQWYDCRFVVENVEYHTAEQYMMARKAERMGDRESWEKIMAAENPRDCKALGRGVRPFDPEVWDREKYGIVLTGNLAKFSQNPDLLDFLSGTGDSVLAEGSPYDGIWGVRMHAEDPDIANPNLWKGENLLGLALMEVRDILQEGCQAEI